METDSRLFLIESNMHNMQKNRNKNKKKNKNK